MSVATLALTALPFVLSPGTSFAITIDAAGRGDQRAPLKVWTGTALGLAVIASITAFSGIGEFFTAHDTARTVFGSVGGAILMTYGILSGIKALRAAQTPETTQPPARRLILWAFLALITNIKALTLYTLVVPNLRTAGSSAPALFTAFTAVHAVMMLAWLLLVGEGVRHIPGIATSPRVRAALTGIAALTLVTIGTQTLLRSLT